MIYNLTKLELINLLRFVTDNELVAEEWRDSDTPNNWYFYDESGNPYTVEELVAIVK
jgi:hypothetical protein